MPGFRPDCAAAGASPARKPADCYFTTTGRAPRTRRTRPAWHSRGGRRNGAPEPVRRAGKSAWNQLLWRPPVPTVDLGAAAFAEALGRRLRLVAPARHISEFLISASSFCRPAW